MKLMTEIFKIKAGLKRDLDKEENRKLNGRDPDKTLKAYIQGRIDEANRMIEVVGKYERESKLEERKLESERI